MIARWSITSLVRFLRPESCLPSMLTVHKSSGFMNPLETSVGVQTTSFSAIRNEMFPSLAAAKPFL